MKALACTMLVWYAGGHQPLTWCRLANEASPSLFVRVSSDTCLPWLAPTCPLTYKGDCRYTISAATNSAPLSLPRPAHVAPAVCQVLRRKYGKEADLWSAGVILYILLSGVPPFWGETEQQIFDAILKGHVDFQSDPWPRISGQAKDCVRMLLTPVRGFPRRSTAGRPSRVIGQPPNCMPRGSIGQRHGRCR